ncbi:MAG TPA: VIT domain-containing protein, partial [Bacteroidales bacterium]|nr:VIT domain-containing protein [Bacteroidales bacterium]
MKIVVTTLLSIVLYTSTLFAYSYIQVVDPRNGGLWTQGTIKKATVIISPQGDYALYDLELELGVGKLSNSKSYDSLEITCNFSLPAGSYVTAASLLIGTEWVQANVLPRPEAHAIYEGFVKRRVDPLIVYKNYDDTYVLKIFPISPTNTRTMRLSYAMPLLSTNGFQSADVVLDLIKASQEPVDVSVLIK